MTEQQALQVCPKCRRTYPQVIDNAIVNRHTGIVYHLPFRPIWCNFCNVKLVRLVKVGGNISGKETESATSDLKESKE